MLDVEGVGGIAVSVLDIGLRGVESGFRPIPTTATTTNNVSITKVIIVDLRIADLFSFISLLYSLGLPSRGSRDTYSILVHKCRVMLYH